MNSKFRTQYVLILFYILISCSSPEKPEQTYDYDLLIKAASMTSMNFNESGMSISSGSFVKVPNEYWAKEIKEENPIRVYSHNNNIALVLDDNESIEEGLYIYVAFSSYIPQSDDNITYTTLVENVYEFIKKK